MRHTTAAGQTVEVTGGPRKAYTYCHGCTSGQKISADRADQIANRHAATCRRVPGAARNRPAHINASR